MLRINKSILMVCLISLFLLVSQASAADADMIASDINLADESLIIDDKMDLSQNQNQNPIPSMDKSNCSQSLENVKNNDLDNNDNAKTEIAEEKDTRSVVMAGDNYSCGPASLATALNKLGMNLSLNEVSAHTNTSIENGTTMQSLIDAAKCFNYSAIGVSIESKDLVENSIVHLNLGGGQHWTVLSRISEGHVFLADSTEGNINLTIDEFNSCYSGKAILLTKIAKQTTEISSNAKVLDSSECMKISGKGMKKRVVGYRIVKKIVAIPVWKKVLKPRVVNGHVSFTCWEYSYSKVYTYKVKKVKEPIYKYYYVADDALTSAKIKK